MGEGNSHSFSIHTSGALTGVQLQLFIMRSCFLLLFSLLLVSPGTSAVITGVSGRLSFMLKTNVEA